MVALSTLPAAEEAPPGKVISDEVEAAVASSQAARIIIYLDLPEAAAMGPARRKAEVSRVQELLLAGLTDHDFSPRWQFETIPALAGEITASGLAKLRGLPGVVRVDLDPPATGHLAESVPLIKASQVQSLGYRGQGISVAILDTGVDTDHPDLSDDLVGQECFCSPNCCPNGTNRQSGPGAAEDGHGHGSNVAGIVTSRGVVAPTGVAPDAKIVAIRVLDSNGQSCCSSDIVAGLDWVAANRPDVRVVNMSLGSFTLFPGNCDNATSFTMAYASVINALRTQGVITFASAGNDASGTQMPAPACIANTVSVGATYDANIGGVGFTTCADSTTFADKVTCFTNSNSTTDLFAPGAAITSCWLMGMTSTFYGTSQASPHAAGCAADLLSVNSALSPAQIEAALKSSGVPVTDPKNNLTFPRIDCLGALAALGACVDLDHDGYGKPGSSQCPHGAATDCDDTRASVYPGAPQLCDGLNNDCTAPGWPAVPANEVDADADGYPLCNDCSDNQATVYPGAPQLCDGINNDCNAPGWPAVPANEVDADGDGRRACNDCNDANATIYPGAPQICDGVNNDCNAPGWPGLAGTNEADDDGDGKSECQGDCLDSNAAVYPGAPQICDGLNNNCSAPGWPSTAGTNEADDDLDTFTECAGDCDDAHASVHPGAPQVCDGINNDCSAPGWPALAGTSDGDDDGDLQSECQSDCNDADPAIYSGAPEINDGKDNQCPANPGYGVADEISGVLGFTNAADRNEISWPAQPGAGSYEVQRSASPIPATNPYLLSVLTATPIWSDGTNPPEGTTFFYLARPTAPHLGSWGQKSSGQERVGLANPESICNDSLDNDGDGQTDCADPDCFPAPNCAPAVFSFTDTLGDDIASGALTSFFSSLTPSSSDYLFFALAGPGVTDYSICAQHADFYRDNYLNLAPTGGSAVSGSWNRWTLQEGGAWSAPDTGSHTNLFGSDCLESLSWCPESSLAGRDVAILPDQTAECESFDFSIGCGPGSWQVTIKIGHTRLSTCGF